MTPSRSFASPVFVVGCQRSGTTFLASQLGKRTGSLVVPESRFFSDALRKVSCISDLSTKKRTFLHLVRAHWRFRIWGISGEFDEAFDQLFDCKDLGQIIFKIVKLYGSKVGWSTHQRWIDHTPENVAYGMTLWRAFPDAKFVHLVRDGRAVANSVLNLPWGPITAEEAAEWWTRRVGYALALESAVGDQALRVHYESLVVDPESVFERIESFVGKNASKTGNEPGKGFSVPRYTRDQHKLVNSAPNVARSEAWKTDLRDYEILAFEREARDFLDYLGYEQHQGGPRPHRRVWDRKRLSWLVVLVRRWKKLVYSKTKKSRAGQVST